MPGKIIEKNGEKYIISDNIDPEELDTDNLIEKEVFPKNFNTVHPLPASMPEKQKEIESARLQNTDGIPAIFTFFTNKKKILFLGFLVFMDYCDNKTIYEIRFGRLEIIEIMIHLQKNELFFLSSVGFPHPEKPTDVLRLNKKTGCINRFIMKNFTNSSGNCKLIFGIKE